MSTDAPTPREELAAVPTRQQVNDFACVLMNQWEIVEGKPVSASYVATFADMARALLASSALARVIREAKAEAWDEGRRAEHRDWVLVFDLSTPDEDRQPWPNPYRDLPSPTQGETR